MTHSPSVEIDGRTIRLIGDLTTVTVPALFHNGPDLSEMEMTVDLEKVGEVDSSALALLVHWSNQSEHHDLHFVHAPDSLRELAFLAGVGQLFVNVPRA